MLDNVDTNGEDVMKSLESIKKHLEKIGADGLAGDDCGCSIDNLAPCEDRPGDCVPARRITCKPDDCYACEFSCGGYRAGRQRFEAIGEFEK